MNKCCNGKQRFLTKEEAAKRLSPRRWKEVHQYHCAWCGYWHNGSSESHRKKTLARKEKKRKKLEKAEGYDGRYEEEAA